MQITIYNPETTNLEKSYLTKSAESGDTTLNVKNTNNFTSDAFLLVGEMGREKSEIAQVSSVDDEKTVSLSEGLNFSHTADKPVYVMHYDKIKLYRSTDGIDGDYTELDELDIDVDNTDSTTRFKDEDAAPSYYYKTSFYNSVTSNETAQSDPVSATGHGHNTVGDLVEEVLWELEDHNQHEVHVQQIIRWANRVSEDLIKRSKRPYDFLRTKKVMSLKEGESEVGDYPDDFWKAQRRAVVFKAPYSHSDDIYSVRLINDEEYTYLEGNPASRKSHKPQYMHLSQTDKKIYVYPTPSRDADDAITFYYYKNFDRLESLADELETPDKSVYFYGIMTAFFRSKARREASYLQIMEQWEAAYINEILQMQRTNKAQVGRPTGTKPPLGHDKGFHRY